MTAPPPVLSPSSILLPPSPYCSCIPTGTKIGACFKNIILFLLFFLSSLRLKLHIMKLRTSGRVCKSITPYIEAMCKGLIISSGNELFSMAQQRQVGQGLPITEASRSHSDTPHSVRLPWTSDQPDAQIST